jgi:hypothetical protein
VGAQLTVARDGPTLQDVRMRPATIFALGLALLVGIGIWITLAGAGDEARPPGAAADHGIGRGTATPPPAAEREPAVVDRPVHGDPAGVGTAPLERPRSEPAETAANVTLRVRTTAGHGDVSTFTWRFRNDANALRGEGRHGRADLRLPPDGNGQLLVESPGFAPFTTDVAAPAEGRPALSIDAFLDPAAQAAGITLLVHDTALQPVPNVRVDAFPLLAEGSRDAWHLGASLWARRSAAADGRYELPGLAPGDYGIRVLATDADGNLLPLLPYLHTFVLTGSSGYVEDVVLEPGCVPEFELLDAAGAPLDPKTTGVVQLHLTLPGTNAVPRMWTLRHEGRVTAALDTLPGSGVVAVAQPVPAGTYAFEVSIAGQQRVQQFVTLRAGERQQERIVVP